MNVIMAIPSSNQWPKSWSARTCLRWLFLLSETESVHKDNSPCVTCDLTSSIWWFLVSITAHYDAHIMFIMMHHRVTSSFHRTVDLISRLPLDSACKLFQRFVCCPLLRFAPKLSSIISFAACTALCMKTLLTNFLYFPFYFFLLSAGALVAHPPFPLSSWLLTVFSWHP